MQKLSTNKWTRNFFFLLTCFRIDSHDTFFFDIRKLVASSETRYCASIVYEWLFINFF